MKKHLFIFSLIVSQLGAQTTTFDNLNANPLTNKTITWTSSNYGSGFGHRIINTDPGGHTLLNFQGRHNKTTWSNIMSLSTNGNVGIGTANPIEKLHISGNILGDKLLLNDPNDTSDWNILWQSGFYQSYNATNAPEATGWFWGLNMNHGSNNSNYRYSGQIAIKNSYASPVLYFRSVNSNGIGTWAKVLHNQGNQTINGNLGIGTANTKGFKLGVQGKIAATEVKVATYANWADFVFDDGYNLPTLKEVEQHIKEKGHLKDIPSAKEVKEDGFFLGEMDSKLLQKIEELTLYTIEQQKEIEFQRNKLENQNNKIEKLEKENKELQSLSMRLLKIEKLLSINNN
ncbi:pyocin knob domain-containing protein [Flavivirga eckloniae]|uniref:Peptidase S74 domain-containing protein n=1 Tax=Flavivirga eckloniae TaxID=1803846 RepID=A0A2K9PP58_9FLAO|nr:pyocin knob domain-containing protein [Flavivirga eckloniae]AUP78826.1 hypothetical protein C1H87_08980 [Flavivirga eckloniae]